MAKNKKKQGAYRIVLILSVLIGLLCGLMTSNLLDQYDADAVLWVGLILLVGIYVSLIINTVIHEAGHLLFGLMTGYQFSSFRIFSFMWIKENGKIRLKHHSVAGTAGQCLMTPPALNDGNYPVLVYNLGGVFTNLYTALCFFMLAILCSDLPILSTLMYFWALQGLIFALTNGIPFTNKLLSNDGQNALMLTKSNTARRSFWYQLKINELISGGMRPKDIPEEWFTVPADHEMENSIVATMGVMACGRLMDAHKFAEADALMAHILQMDSGITGFHRNLLTCERIYIKLITENRWNTVQSMMTKELKDFMKTMKHSYTILRVQYAYALLAERDRITADRLMAQFEKRTKKSPYAGDVQSERELMEIAREHFQ